MLANAEAIARKLVDDVQRDQLLTEVALAADDATQRRLLIEIANRRPADLGIKNSEQCDREIVEVFAVVAGHLPPTEQRLLISEALTIARSKGIREYDQARAFLALLPNLTPTEQVVLLEEIRCLARALKNLAEKAEIVVALVPLVPRDQVENAQQEALVAARAAPASGFQVSGRIDDELRVTIDRTSKLRRGELLALLARCSRPERRLSIVEEAVDSLADMDAEGQAVTLTEFAGLLSETVISNLLKRLQEVEADRLRMEIISIVLRRLADLESPDAARKEASDIWGENVPELVAKTLATDSPPPDTRLSAEVRDANTPVESSRVTDDSRISFTISLCPLTALYQLAASTESAIGIVAFDSSQIEKGSAAEAELAKNVIRQVAREHVSKLPPEDLREILGGLREFRSGEAWQHARAALVSRLAELGALDKAYSESRVFWPEGLPAQVSYSFWQGSVNKSQESLLQQTLPSALKIQNVGEKARLLGRLLPHVRNQERASIISEIATAAISALTDSPVGQVDDELVQIVLSLPGSVLLHVWHESLRKLATFDRKDMLIALPPLLSLGSKLSQGQLWSDVADTIRRVHKRWP